MGHRPVDPGIPNVSGYFSLLPDQKPGSPVTRPGNLKPSGMTGTVWRLYEGVSREKTGVQEVFLKNGDETPGLVSPVRWCL